MIAGLCESPLTFQAIIIWRDELNDAKILLRDIIDLEATYEGPEAKAPPPLNAEGLPQAEIPLPPSVPTVSRCPPPMALRVLHPRMSPLPPPRRRRPRSVPPRLRPAVIPRKRNPLSLPPTATWMTTSSKTRCRSPPSRPS